MINPRAPYWSSPKSKSTVCHVLHCMFATMLPSEDGTTYELTHTPLPTLAELEELKQWDIRFHVMIVAANFNPTINTDVIDRLVKQAQETVLHYYAIDCDWSGFENKIQFNYSSTRACQQSEFETAMREEVMQLRTSNVGQLNFYSLNAPTFDSFYNVIGNEDGKA